MAVARSAAFCFSTAMRAASCRSARDFSRGHGSAERLDEQRDDLVVVAVAP